MICDVTPTALEQEAFLNSFVESGQTRFLVIRTLSYGPPTTCLCVGVYLLTDVYGAIDYSKDVGGNVHVGTIKDGRAHTV